MPKIPGTIEEALQAFMHSQDLHRDEAVDLILADWLSRQGYLGQSATETRQQAAKDETKADPDFVQYPAYFDNGSL